jgi:hypothetical protein
MKKLLFTAILGRGYCLTASADIWMWADAEGDIHFVNTSTAIYTWQDEKGRVHYADTPGDETAVLVDLVWHSTGDLDDSGEPEVQQEARNEYPDETEAERNEREMAEAYYCKRATEIYDSYKNAPQLYKTNENGQREYLSDEEVTATLTDTKARVEELCN